MTNEEIVAEIQQGVNVSGNMGELYSQNEYLIGSIVNEIGHDRQDHEDCMQEAYFGLYEAAMKYDPDRGIMFMSYAPFWIRNAVIRYLRNNTAKRVPANVSDTLHKVQKAQKEYLDEYGTEPDLSCILYKLGISEEKYDRCLKYVSESHVMSIDSTVSQDDGDDLTLGDMVSDPNNGIDNILEDTARDQASNDIWECVEELPEREKEVVKQRYQEGATYKEIAARTGISVNAISNAQRKAKRLLSANERMKLAAKVYGIYDAAYRGSASSFNTTWTSSTEKAAMRLIELHSSHYGRIYRKAQKA